jgi:Uma2 family endonuclease
MEAHARQPTTLAPWAEIVPGVGLMTVDCLLRRPDDDGWRYEVVEGVLVRMAGSRPKAVRITDRLYRALGNYIDAHGLGQTTLPDAVYDFEHTGQPNTGLLPDIGFYYAAREPLVENDRPYPFAPDLDVEIASPSQNQEALDAKARRYLAGGTALVWVVWPDAWTVDVWRPRNTRRPSKTLRIGDLLDGEDVVGGFTYPLADLFR